MESSDYDLTQLVKNGILPLEVEVSHSSAMTSIPKSRSVRKHEVQSLFPVSLKETLFIEREPSRDNEVIISNVPLPESSHRLVRALLSELQCTIIGRGMIPQITYFPAPVQATWRGTVYGTRQVTIPYPTLRTHFVHTPESEHSRITAIERRHGGSPYKNAVSLRDVLVFFLTPIEAIFRITSNATEVGAKITTQNNGIGKIVRLPSHTYNNMHGIRNVSDTRESMDSGIEILLPPDHNGIYNPIFDNKKGELKYLHVWENVSADKNNYGGISYSRALAYFVHQLSR